MKYDGYKIEELTHIQLYEAACELDRERQILKEALEKISEKDRSCEKHEEATHALAYVGRLARTALRKCFGEDSEKDFVNYDASN